jgi:hypothetical protein
MNQSEKMIVIKMLKKIFFKKTENTELEKIENIVCPVCGYYCIGKGGIGCIDKKSLYENQKLLKDKE